MAKLLNTEIKGITISEDNIPDRSIETPIFLSDNILKIYSKINNIDSNFLSFQQGTVLSSNSNTLLSCGKMVINGSLNVGTNTNANGAFSVALGYNTTATKPYSIAFGRSSKATAWYSIAGGYNNSTASAQNAISLGNNTKANGAFSVAIGINTIVNGQHSIVSGSNNSINGIFCFGEGSNNIITQNASYCHIEGSSNKLDGTGNKYSHAEGFENISNGAYSHIEGYGNKINHSIKIDSGGTLYMGDISHAEGYKTVVNGFASHSEGYSTHANGNYSHVQGYLCKANGDCSFAGGNNSSANGAASFAFGENLTTSPSVNNQFVIGKNNTNSDALFIIGSGSNSSSKKNSFEVYSDRITINDPISNGFEITNCNTVKLIEVGQDEGEYKSIILLKSNIDLLKLNNIFSIKIGNTEYSIKSIISSSVSATITFNNKILDEYINTNTNPATIKNGTSVSVVGLKDYTLDIYGNAIIGSPNNKSETNSRLFVYGEIFANKTSINHNSDFAEYFEWDDKNINNEKRYGYFVSLTEKGTIKIANSTDDILGVCSATASVIGNDAAFEWQGKYLKNEVGETDYDENGLAKINPEYDASKKYIPRSQRPEWTTIGLLGQVYLYDDGTCIPGKYCKPTDNGKGTFSDDKSDYKVIKRINDHTIKILIK